MSQSITRMSDGFRVLPASRLPSNGLVLSETVHEGGVAHARHIHETAYFDMVLAGAHTEHFKGGQFDLNQSSLAYRPAGWEHHNRVSPAGTRCFNVELGLRWLERHEIQALLPSRPCLFVDSILKNAMQRLLRELRSPDAFSSIVIDGVVLELVAQSVRSKTQPHSAPKWLTMVQEMLSQEATTALTLTSVAERVGVHPSHLARTVRRYCGCSVGELVRSQRVHAAADQIRNSNTPLSIIALNSGFCDQAHLTRAMTRELGVTPAHLRREAGRTTRPKSSRLFKTEREG